MTIAIFTEQYSSGTNAPTGTASAFNQRALNSSSTGNNLVGCTLDPATNTVSLPAGTYKIQALAKQAYYQRGQLCVWDYTNNLPLIVGISSATPTGTAFSQADLTVHACDVVQIPSTISVGLNHYVGVVLGVGTTYCLGMASDSGQVENYAQLIIEA